VYLAMAQDGVFFKRMAVIHPKWRTPAFSLIGQGIWAAALTLSGRYDQLYTYVIYGMVLSYTLTVVAMFWLRWKRPEIPRPYRCNGISLAPGIYVLIGIAWILNTTIRRPLESFVSIAIVLVGVPFYFVLETPQPTAESFTSQRSMSQPSHPSQAMSGASLPQSDDLNRPKQVMGFRDLVLFYVITGISLRWIATAAAAGPSSIVVWVGAWLCFYTPLALSVLELSSRYPNEGGLYVWSKRAFGDFSGFMAAWTYWTSNLPYFPQSSTSPPATSSSCGRRTGNIFRPTQRSTSCSRFSL